jgi:hypothetical protein
MPGIVVRTAAQILLEIGDASAFKSSGHLAAYAGIAPVTRSSGSSIKGERPGRVPATATSNERSSWPRSRPRPIPPIGPTTTESAQARSVTLP